MRDIQPLLDLGVDPECPSSGHILETFAAACKKGDAALVNAFLGAGLWTVDAMADYRESANDGPPLHKACEGGDLPTVQALVEAGFPIEVRDRDGDTPLMTANNWKHPGIAAYLLEQGADPNPVNNKGQSAVGLAAKTGDLALIRSLAKRGASLDTGTSPPLEMAQENAAAFRLLLDLGADVNVRSAFGLPLVHALFLYPNAVDVARLLVARGARLGPDRYGVDAWFCARWRGSDVPELTPTGDNEARWRMLSAARDGGVLPDDVDIEIQNASGETALLLAVTRKDWPMATSLLARGASPFATGSRVVKMANTFDALTRLVDQRWNENITRRKNKEPVPEEDAVPERAAFARALLDAIRARGGWPAALRCPGLVLAVRVPDPALLVELIELGAPLWSEDTLNYVLFDLAGDDLALVALDAMRRRGDFRDLATEADAEPDLCMGLHRGDKEVRSTLMILGDALCEAAKAGRVASTRALLALLPPNFRRPMTDDGQPIWNGLTYPAKGPPPEDFQAILRTVLEAGVDLGSWGWQAPAFGSQGVNAFSRIPDLDAIIWRWVADEPFYTAWAQVAGVPRAELPTDPADPARLDPAAIALAEQRPEVWAALSEHLARVDTSPYYRAWARFNQAGRIRGAACAGIPMEPQQPMSTHALEDAAKLGHVESMRALVEGGADVDRRGWNGRTALFMAAYEGPLESITTLLELGANPNGPTGYKLLPAAAKRGTRYVQALLDGGARADRPRAGNTLLHESRDPELIARLAAAGGLRARNKDGLTPLHAAAARKDPAAVEAMLAALDPAALTEALTTTDKQGRTALHHAVKAGSPEGVSVLLPHLARAGGVDAADADGQTALHIAAGAGNVELVTLLLAAGADRTRTDPALATAATLARRFPDVLALLEAPAVPVTRLPTASPLGRALLFGDDDTARAAVEAATVDDLNALGPDGFHALHHVITRGDAALVELVLDRGANVNAPDKSGMKPRNFAHLPGYDAAALVFTRSGIAQNLMEYLDAGTWYAELQDALHRQDIAWLLDAVESGRVDLQRLNPRMSLLTWLLATSHFEAVRTLLALGARPDVVLPGGADVFRATLRAEIHGANMLGPMLAAGLVIPADALVQLVRLRGIEDRTFADIWDRLVALGADEEECDDEGNSALEILRAAERYEDSGE